MVIHRSDNIFTYHEFLDIKIVFFLLIIFRGGIQNTKKSRKKIIPPPHVFFTI